MSLEENKKIVQAFYDAVSRQDLDAAEQLVDENVVTYGMPVPPGRVAFRGVGEMFKTAFPDGHVTIQQFVAEGDLVAVLWSFTGTNQGELMGIPPSGKQVQYTGMSIDRIRGGKIVEHWVSQDQLGMLQQMGVIPQMGGAAG